MSQVLNIGYLYGNCMNTYGDLGNVLAFKKRAEWRGIKINIKLISFNSKHREGLVDIYFFGGGQDKTQEKVSEDMLNSNLGQTIIADIERGIPLLAISGGFQLLGEYYKVDDHVTPGLNILPIYTQASQKRMVGIIRINTVFGEVIGFENHSGETFLKKNAHSFGQVVKGWGNNHEDQVDGCRYKNVIGSNLHGPLLPKNPAITDWLLLQTLIAKFPKRYSNVSQLKRCDDSIEDNARNQMLLCL